MTKDLLFDIIKVLNECGYDVVGMVSDMGPTNRALWNELNISLDKTYFMHPSTSHRVHVFADVPHLLKLARNHFVTRLVFIIHYIMNIVAALY